MNRWNRSNCLFYALSDAKPLRTFAGNAQILWGARPPRRRTSQIGQHDAVRMGGAGKRRLHVSAALRRRHE
ncbi:hypothetical protein CQ060_17005 [Ochrobactrum sp. MYb237]|nr:hypothetical protein F9K82_18315 [Brucella pseudogrignonensis]MQP41676.1 hypothetical protein [Ochrobactrum sp. MYb237]